MVLSGGCALRDVVAAVKRTLSGHVYRSFTIIYSFKPSYMIYPCRRAALAAILAFAIVTTGLPGRAAAEDCGGGRSLDWVDTMIGQMLMFGFDGTRPSQKGPQAIKSQLCDGSIGGVILLGHNVKSRAQVEALTRLFQSADAQITPLIAVDQEGGKVQRLGGPQGYPVVPRAATIARKYSTREARKIYDAAAAVVRDAGFNVNFAPVVDVNVYAKNPIIGKHGRSFSSASNTVIDYARVFIDAHHRMGILTALKHFPGHGSSRRDSHKAFVDISDTWTRERELAPFSALANDPRYGDMVMVGHLYHNELSPGGRIPATLSADAINGLLRDKMGYQGVVVTDDLEMRAVRDNFSYRETIVKAVLAGNDILLISNSDKPDLKLPEKTATIIKQAVNAGEIGLDVLERAFDRIRLLKKKLALLEQNMARQN